MLRGRRGAPNLLALVAVAAGSLTAALADPASDQTLVQNHVQAEAAKTFRPAKGVLRYPYLVPAGPYEEMWDWDSMFMGVALSDYGAIPYFTGTFMNFLVRCALSALSLCARELSGGTTGNRHDLR